MELKLQKVSAQIQGWKIQDVSFKAESGTIVSIVGPSGSGKTTILRIIAGLQKNSSGQIFFDQKEVSNTLAEQRNIGFVFQGDSLFSHLNVFENVAFGLRARKEKNIQQKVARALELVHLRGFEKRNTNTLSGGEKKRVAIARAIAFDPDLLLLDEPLNGLDAELKEKTKRLIKELKEKTGKTIVFVTHDIDEAFFLSDQIIVLSNGKIEQAGEPKEIFLHPKNIFVKKFVQDYELVFCKTKKIGGKTFISAELLFETKEKENKNALINLKKTNFKIEK